jgi:hypothetical protein
MTECYRCGSDDHYVRDCPLGERDEPKRVRSRRPPRFTAPRVPPNPEVARRGAKLCRQALGLVPPEPEQPELEPGEPGDW